MDLDLQVPDDASELDDDPGDLLEPDPRPVRAKGPTKKRQSTTKATAAQKRQIIDSVELALELAAGLASFRDPVCGGALQDVSAAAAARCVPIITRSPVLMQFFVGSGAPFMEYLGLGIALRPFIATVWGHHVTKTIGHDHDGGVDGADWSQYTTAPAFSG